MSLAEYRELKNKLVQEKAALSDKKKRFEEEGEYRLEPLMGFVKSLQGATLLASTEKSVEKVKYLKKTGSNLTIQNRAVQFEFREPWKTVENQGRFAHCETRAPDSGARVIGETHPISTSTEEQGFEPWRPLQAHRFSRMRTPAWRYRKRRSAATPLCHSVGSALCRRCVITAFRSVPH